MHETESHEDNCFITLTYDDETLPKTGSLVKDDMQKFMKRLRKWLEPNKVRYYACGEYGDDTNRPHYHSIMFGYWPDDAEYHKASKSGDKYYTSEKLNKLWGKGYVIIGEATFESAAYVARYVTKKITGGTDEAKKKMELHYNGRTPEFSLMSRRPGIGLNWYRKYGKETWDSDTVVMRGKEMHAPAYYYKKLQEEDENLSRSIKSARKKKMVELTDDQLYAKSQITIAKQKTNKKTGI